MRDSRDERQNRAFAIAPNAPTARLWPTVAGKCAYRRVPRLRVHKAPRSVTEVARQ